MRVAHAVLPAKLHGWREPRAETIAPETFRAAKSLSLQPPAAHATSRVAHAVLSSKLHGWREPRAEATAPETFRAAGGPCSFARKTAWVA